MDHLASDLPPGSATAQQAGPYASLDLAVQSLLQPLRELLERIETRLNGAGGTGVSPVLPSAPRQETATTAEPVDALIERRFEQMEYRLAAFREETLSLLDRVADAIAEGVPDAPRGSHPPTQQSPWDRIFLGDELCQNPELDSCRQRFLDDVTGGVDAARALAGQMLLVQTAPADQMAELLKNVGEAYYRWRPRTSPAEDPMERALAAWLTRRAESAGLRNSIQLVRPGERFDGSRLVADGRGVEVVAVHGWVVLRDGNKVYTKANVSVK